MKPDISLAIKTGHFHLLRTPSKWGPVKMGPSKPFQSRPGRLGNSSRPYAYASPTKSALVQLPNQHERSPMIGVWEALSEILHCVLQGCSGAFVLAEFLIESRHEDSCTP